MTKRWCGALVRIGAVAGLLVAAAFIDSGLESGSASAADKPSIELPNPYAAGTKFGQLPPEHPWGGVIAVAPDRDGKSIWAFERCGGDCLKSKLPPVLEFDASGKLIKSFGADMFAFPHGIAVDKDGNVYVADADGKNGKGDVVVKFNPDGKVLMTLGHPGMPGDAPGYLNKPSAVTVAPDGTIFVADGHGGDSNARIVKFSATGQFIKAWGKKGSGPGEFNEPHGIALDSTGRVFVADRVNSRIQIFDADGKFLAEWTQFGRPSAVFIDKNDVIYVADSQTEDKEGCTTDPGCRRGIRIGNAKDGSVTAYIPRPNPATDTSGGEGVAADAAGDVFGAENVGKGLRKYVKK
ncbi:MAG TPA: peptidyl-alpha-hydroxyglycine alpha-amidating lyase family protein [Stellaceae bacterium]|jgi:sugar lactone lactonase YvrE|nr:peptidyl-alpha-hydroxyglycine alpha-amidating lyase family protein [Stellaceae bacterium]